MHHRRSSETVGPVVTAPGEYLDGLVHEMDLHPVAVELDLVEPALAARDFFDRCRQRWFGETGVRRFDADRLRVFTLERHDKTPRNELI